MEKSSDDMMFCRSCKLDRPLSRFNKRIRLGLRKYEACMDCGAAKQAEVRSVNKAAINARRREQWGKRHREYQKNYMLKKAYGITLKQWGEMFEAQGKVCAICGTDEPKGRGWQTDHDHQTGAIRSILCHHCNTLLGHSIESEEILMSAIAYLRKHNANRIFDLAGAMGLDMGGAIAQKMDYNATREDHKIENRRAEGGKAY